LKVCIFAGGWGTRLGQMAETIPKPMVLIGNKPILWHIMKIYSSYGYNDFIIMLGVKGHIIKQYFYNFEALNSDFTLDMSTGQITYHNHHHEMDWKVTLVDTGLNNQKGSRLKQIEPYLDDEINLLTYGDGVSDVNIPEVVKFHKSHGKLVTITGARPMSRYGELTLDGNRVAHFSEKPNNGRGFINGGFMVFSRGLLDYLSTDEDCDLETGAFEVLSKRGELMVYKHTGHWACMDHERDVRMLNDLWNQKKAFWKVWT